MAAPTPYALAYDFTSFQSSNPTTPLPADKLEIEFNALQTTTDELIANLGAIQRSDNALANNSVGNDQLKSEVTIGVNPAADWVTGTEYEANDTVYESNKVYRALEAHTAGVFATDLAADKWSEILDFDQFITATESDLTAVEADNTAIEADLASVESDYSAVESDYSAVESDAGAVETDLSSTEGDSTATAADLVSVEADLAATEGDATTTTADAAATESDLGAVETDLSSVESDLAATEGDATTTEGDATATAADLVAVEADVASIEGDLTATEADLAAVEADAAAVETDLAALAITYTKISETSITAVANIDVTDLSSSYDAYLFRFENFKPGTDTVHLYGRYSTDNGSSFITSSTYRHSSSRSMDTSYTRSTAEAFMLLIGNMGSASLDTAYADFIMHKPDTANGFGMLYGTGTMQHMDNWASSFHSAGRNTTTSAIDAIRFYFSSGNFAAQGTLKVYGINYD